MNVAKICSADDVSVRLCFLVRVRNAKGRSVAGGSRIGSMDGFEDSEGLETLIGYPGVPNAGDEEGIEVRYADCWAAGSRGAVRVRGSLLEGSIILIDQSLLVVYKS